MYSTYVCMYVKKSQECTVVSSPAVAGSVFVQKSWIFVGTVCGSGFLNSIPISGDPDFALLTMAYCVTDVPDWPDPDDIRSG